MFILFHPSGSLEVASPGFRLICSAFILGQLCSFGRFPGSLSLIPGIRRAGPSVLIVPNLLRAIILRLDIAHSAEPRGYAKRPTLIFDVKYLGNLVFC